MAFTTIRMQGFRCRLVRGLALCTKDLPYERANDRRHESHRSASRAVVSLGDAHADVQRYGLRGARRAGQVVSRAAQRGIRGLGAQAVSHDVRCPVADAHGAISVLCAKRRAFGGRVRRNHLIGGDDGSRRGSHQRLDARETGRRDAARRLDSASDTAKAQRAAAGSRQCTDADRLRCAE